ncbi:PREDICTED: uncharacterized protein LOC108555263 [Eufriesea mexicana]|uniref:uncharacterized protein LOC108555263 n=1 Tax=Eufriesea mexicana TaxID=516756 RepID=UPI00083C024F|nr:PREDICTED: uncharacterized protein LOC108555263 [Eufriesea mexicana]
MVLIGDISSIFTAGWLLGCTVLIATKDDIKARRFRDVIFIVFSMSLYLVSFFVLYIFVFSYKDLDPKTMLLIILRVLLAYWIELVDAALTTLWNWKIRSVISQLRNFDRVTKYRDASKGNKLRFFCRITVVFVFLYWCIVAYLSYRIELRVPGFRGIVYFFADASVNIQVLIFVGILFLIEERFRHLCNIVTFFKDDKLVVADRSIGHFTLQQIWWLHCTLANAAEMINSVYSIQLLFWIPSMSFNLLSRIYSLHVFILTDLGKIRELMLTFGCALNLILITTMCHITASQANRVGRLIFSPNSSVSMKRMFLQENIEAVAYFQLRKVHFFTTIGIIRIDLPLLLSIFSAMTTYLVILT